MLNLVQSKLIRGSFTEDRLYSSDLIWLYPLHNKTLSLLGDGKKKWEQYGEHEIQRSSKWHIFKMLHYLRYKLGETASNYNCLIHIPLLFD